MATIQDLQKIDLTKVKNEQLLKWTKDLINDYNTASDKQKMEQIAKQSIDKVFGFIKQTSPDALVSEDENPCEEELAKAKKKTKIKTKKTSPGKRSEKNTSPKTKKTLPLEITKKKIAVIDMEIKQCRLKIRKYNEAKRKEEGPKPKTSRYAKIKSHFVAIGNQIPNKFKENLKVQQEVEKILLRSHRQIIDAFGMSKLKAKEDQKAIKEKYERIEEKLAK